MQEKAHGLSPVLIFVHKGDWFFFFQFLIIKKGWRAGVGAWFFFTSRKRKMEEISGSQCKKQIGIVHIVLATKSLGSSQMTPSTLPSG